jgi:uncharacterized protein DUF4185
MPKPLVSAENQGTEAPSRERSFGKLTKGWANNTISRSQALKLVGAAILSATLVPLFPRRILPQLGYNWWGASDVQHVPGSTLRMSQMTGDYDPQGLTHINYTGQWGIEGTDLGISVEHQGKLFIFFGDVPSANDADPIVYTTDLDAEPHGFQLHPILWSGSGTNYRPFNVKSLSDKGYLGTNETPTGAFSYGDRVYVFVITGNIDPVSYLSSSANLAADFDLHYKISDIAGKFWQIAPWVVNNAEWPGLPSETGDGVLLWGQGLKEGGWSVYLAWMALPPSRYSPAHMKYYTGPGISWSDEQQEAFPLFFMPNVSALSVGWIPEVRRWLMLYTRASLAHPRESIVCRVAKTPWEWSEEIAIFNPERDGAFTKYMHQPGEDDLNLLPPERPSADSGWAYAPFLLNRYTRWDGQRRIATIYYLMSTNSPYQVMLMRSRLRFANSG